jgi:hypothetical protein
MSKPINVNLNELKTVVCKNCGNSYFIPVFILKNVPAILSGSALPTIIQVPIYKCDSCNTVFDINEKKKNEVTN